MSAPTTSIVGMALLGIALIAVSRLHLHTHRRMARAEEKLWRYQMACSQAEQWLAFELEARFTAEWIHKAGEGSVAIADIGKMRDEMRHLHPPRASVPLRAQEVQP